LYTENYLVQPNPVHFTFESEDLVFFDGSNISLYCETNCVQLGLTSIDCSVGFLYNGCDLENIGLDYAPYEYILYDSKVIGRRTLTILNASSTVNGRYQCYTHSPRFGHIPLTDKIIGRPIHIQIAGMMSLL